MIVKDGKILLAKRISSHGDGEYASPGGHLEHGESIEDCAKRELLEEAGQDMIISDLRFLCFINLRKYSPKHYAHIQMVAEWQSGKPKNTETDIREDWEWYDMNNLPSPLFGTTSYALEAYKTGKNFFEA